MSEQKCTCIDGCDPVDEELGMICKKDGHKIGYKPDQSTPAVQEPYSMLNRARDHVHNWDASPDLEDFVNSHIDELERHVALVIEREEEAAIESQRADIEELVKGLKKIKRWDRSCDKSWNDLKLSELLDRLLAKHQEKSGD